MSTKGFDLTRTPTLQHAVYLIGSTVPETADNIRRLRRGRPPYRLDVARQLIAAVLRSPNDERAAALDWADRQAVTIKDPLLRKATQEILVCVREYLSAVHVKWFRPIAPFFYHIGRDHVIPVNPVGIISDGVEARLVWAQIWRSRTLNAAQFNIHGAVLERAVFSVIPEVTELEWLEMSAPAGAKKRELRLRGRDAYEALSDGHLADALERLATAIDLVNSEPTDPGKKPDRRDPKTRDFFE